MARMIKCCVTGDIGDSSSFYKVNNKWYKNEEIYREYTETKEFRQKIIIKIMELLGYDGCISGNLGSIIGKQIKNNSLSCKELYESLIDKEEYIKEKIDNITFHSKDIEHIMAIFTIISVIPESITYGGCYEIKNLDTDEFYIGETLDMFQRMNQHISDLYFGIHHCASLQEAFDVHKDISHFKFTPLYLYEIKNKNKEIEKHNTLYLECAYFLKYKKEKKVLYNTINPYIALKEKSVSLQNYKIDCKRVLELLTEDKQNILPLKVKEKIKKDLK